MVVNEGVREVYNYKLPGDFVSNVVDSSQYEQQRQTIWKSLFKATKYKTYVEMYDNVSGNIPKYSSKIAK